ncbi:hypothetical protein [Methylobacterium dankookense]|uniref:Uncharacterized protein n=1 Tax=Methylobacterium dankookense TaxID=560405 RepID=A0A564G7N6_9HYPH|nr:hypothetical protein [Methylobacterium dankookense]GJD57647.1 hypothetical protein IFDJLNFL_3554 [Methylobacterium dankookense]VUF16036.1 hypothetical protein MTDSW087_05786 [Methylobacterium dankookense]
MSCSSSPPTIVTTQPPRGAPRYWAQAAVAPQPARPGQRVLPLHRLDPVMQDFFRDQIECGEVPYWIVADEPCIAYASLTPYTAAGTDEPDWGRAFLML